MADKNNWRITQKNRKQDKWKIEHTHTDNSSRVELFQCDKNKVQQEHRQKNRGSQLIVAGHKIS